MSTPGLLQRLQNGGNVVVAEGFVFELERRGFLKLGAFIPEVVLDRPSALRNLHEEFALAGSDVILAFTFYGHREALKVHGREDDVETINRAALKIAREVADNFGKLMAGNLSNTPLYEADRPDLHEKIYNIFKEQVIWAVEGGADFIIGETFNNFAEAALALKAMKDHGNGLPSVITLAAHFPDRTTDEIPIPEACRRLQELGADVVGLNCSRGPDVMLPLVKEIKKVCTIPVAALPLGYRTSEKERTFFALTDPVNGKRVYPEDLDSVRCSRSDIRRFAMEAKEAGVQYVGLCCGNAPNLTREIAEVYGREPPASKYSPDNSKSFILGDNSNQYGPEMQKLRKFMLGETK